MTDPTKQGRTGRPWRRAQQRVRQTSSICYICGHDGSQDVDHIVPLSRGGDPLDPNNHGPIHGVDGCPTCGRKCNQIKGDKLLEELGATLIKTSRDWYAPA